MISRATVFWLIALAVMVAITVTISLRVTHVQREIRDVRAEKALLVEKIRLADSSYQRLIRIERLTVLADRHLDLAEIRGDQLIPLAKLPYRVPKPAARPEAPDAAGAPDTAGRQQSAEPRRAPSAGPAPMPSPMPSPMPVPESAEPPQHAQPFQTPDTPPWLEAAGQGRLQPVTLSTEGGRKP